MKAAAWVTFFYAILILIGGVFGHLKAASSASFITAVVAGALLVLASIGMYKDHLFPCYFGIILIFILDAFFTYRWLLTMQFFPNGMLSILSLIVLVVVVLLVHQHLKLQQKRKR